MAAVESIRVSIECSKGWDRENMQRDHPKFRLDFIKKYAQSLSLPEIIDVAKLGP